MLTVDNDVEDGTNEEQQRNWADQVAEEQWQNEHVKKTQRRKTPAVSKFKSVMIASALDGGVTKLWEPLQVGFYHINLLIFSAIRAMRSEFLIFLSSHHT